MKALVLVEPSSAGDPKLVDRLKNIPMLTIYGDYVEQDSRWRTIRANQLKFLEQVRERAVIGIRVCDVIVLFETLDRRFIATRDAQNPVRKDPLTVDQMAE